jgi:hypothetical protein
MAGSGKSGPPRPPPPPPSYLAMGKSGFHVNFGLQRPELLHPALRLRRAVFDHPRGPPKRWHVRARTTQAGGAAA